MLRRLSGEGTVSAQCQDRGDRASRLGAGFAGGKIGGGAIFLLVAAPAGRKSAGEFQLAKCLAARAGRVTKRARRAWTHCRAKPATAFSFARSSASAKGRAAFG